MVSLSGLHTLSGSKFQKQKLISVKFYSKYLTFLISKINNEFPSVGFIITKKIGSAVVRNKIRRRLRVLSLELLRNESCIGFCYIIIPQKTAVFCSFEELKHSMKFCINKSKRLTKNDTHCN